MAIVVLTVGWDSKSTKRHIHSVQDFGLPERGQEPPD
jgi:hypothetical protein